MKKRPDFKSYLKYHYRMILSTAYESQTITCRSGKVYAMVSTTLYKILRLLILGAGIILLLMQGEAFSDVYTSNYYPLIIASYFVFIALTKILQYFLARYEELDDTNILSLERASRSDRPPFWDYVKNIYKGYNDLTILNDFESSDGHKYSERPIINENIIIVVVLFIWVLAGSFYSIITNIVIFLGLIILYLVISPVRYLYVDFIKVSSNDDHAGTPNISGRKHPTKHSKIMKSVTIAFYAALFYLIIAGPYPLSSMFIQRINSGNISITQQTTFAEAYEIAHTYADTHCGKTELLGFHISFEGEAAIKTRQPTDWMLYFQHLPDGLFDPNQKMNIDKTSTTYMTAYRYVPASKISMQNAPSSPIDIDEILTIIEADPAIDLKETSSLTISGGSTTYKQRPQNTFEVQTDKHHYIVDVINKTARKE